MVGIADALADLLIKFCDLGQKRFTGKVRNICNADKYIGEKAGGKDGKGSSCQLFIDNIQNFVSKGISVFVIDVMKIFYVCGDQGDGEELPVLFWICRIFSERASEEMAGITVLREWVEGQVPG